MKKILLLFASLLTFFQTYAYDFAAVASSGQTLYYNITGSNSVSVTNQTSDYNQYTYPIGDLSIPSTITYNGTTYTITSIGDNAFTRCNALTTPNT